jgi:AcrR family transcriptional regulator
MSGIGDQKTDRFSDLPRLYTKRRVRKPIGTIPVVEETNARIAGLAAELFHEHGITATGVDALSKAAGVSKRTLYERFGNKDGLIAAAYEALDLPVFERFTGAAERATADPRRQLEQLFAELQAAVASPEFRGCPFSNAAAELADPEHPAQKVVRRHKQRFKSWMRSRARAAGAADPDRLARQLMIVYDGAQARALVEHSSRPVRDARQVASVLIDAAVVPAQAG